MGCLYQYRHLLPRREREDRCGRQHHQWHGRWRHRGDHRRDPRGDDQDARHRRPAPRHRPVQGLRGCGGEDPEERGSAGPVPRGGADDPQAGHQPGGQDARSGPDHGAHHFRGHLAECQPPPQRGRGVPRRLCLRDGHAARGLREVEDAGRGRQGAVFRHPRLRDEDAEERGPFQFLRGVHTPHGASGDDERHQFCAVPGNQQAAQQSHVEVSAASSDRACCDAGSFAVQTFPARSSVCSQLWVHNSIHELYYSAPALSTPRPAKYSVCSERSPHWQG
mmetsp:Transcript_70567/g.183965  ORF Transcript_70567/g.183965 Transcript_70567/m.183965 type:complete len:278 (-) Transcript_70567:106-939(-)